MRIDGLPLHPLVVHAPVVLIPLVAVGLVLFLVVPGWRRALGPALAALAIAGAASAALAVSSGEELGEALRRADELDVHRTYGERARLWSAVLAIATVGLVAYERRPRRPDRRVLGLTAAATVAAAAAVTAIGLTGHSGAELAWTERVPPAGLPAADLASAVVDTATEAPASTSTEPPPAAGEPVASTATGEPRVEVVMGEWALITSTDQAPPGPTTFRFRNAGVVPHAFRIRSEGSGGERLEWRSEVVRPGEEATLTADLPVGAYELDCPVEDGHGEHDALGMEAPYDVRADAAPVEGAPVATPAPTGGATAGGATGPQPSGEVSIDVAGFAFAPGEVRVAVGQPVRWTNHDPAPHDATADGWGTGRLAPGATGVATFDRPGRYPYLCTIHPSMTGTIVVDP